LTETNRINQKQEKQPECRNPIKQWRDRKNKKKLEHSGQ